MASEVSYIDYETFLDPAFSASTFANELVLATNDQTDATLDLATPLSRVLFDVQEIDTHIDKLSTTSALPLLEYTVDQTKAGSRVLEKVEEQIASLTENYKRLEQNVIARYEAAEQVRLAADRLCQTVRLGRAVLQCLQNARQLEALTEDLGAGKRAPTGQSSHSMVTAAHTLLTLRSTFSGDDAETMGLDKIALVSAVRSNIVASSERKLLSRSQQIIREFSLSVDPVPVQSVHRIATFAQLQDLRAKVTSSAQVLYLLSPPGSATSPSAFVPTVLINALQSYLQSMLNTSTSALATSLAALPTLDRTLLDISARCRDVVALEALLQSIRPPHHPVFHTSSDVTDSDDREGLNLLQPLLSSLDTPSLPTWFWRSLASNLSSRTKEILNRGGVSARTLRSSRDSVAQSIRECVRQGSELMVDIIGAGPGTEGALRKTRAISWEREAAVMVGSLTGQLGRS